LVDFLQNIRRVVNIFIAKKRFDSKPHQSNYPKQEGGEGLIPYLWHLMNMPQGVQGPWVLRFAFFWSAIVTKGKSFRQFAA